jgi:hypothetical protein
MSAREITIRYVLCALVTGAFVAGVIYVNFTYR